tara:strand:- start:3569 stop:4450 length:882 start_codon:yes stop_codon:yes gene_type:complete
MKRPLSIVIFSKDRAAQLDLCLKSIFKNLEKLSQQWKIEVIYTTSSEEFEKGYDSLKYDWDYSWLYFHQESVYGGFKETLETTMTEWGEYVLFFTDDDVVYRKFPTNDFSAIKEIIDIEKLLCVSFRLGTNTFVQDQYTNSHCLIPDEVIISSSFVRGWNWKEQPKHINFAYPFSLDGTLFLSDMAKKIIHNTPGYHNPNSLEGKAFACIKDYIDELPDKMGCFEKSYVINTPLNRVQSTCHNGAGKFFGSSPDELNTKFLSGGRLSLEGMDFNTIIGAHQELKLCWEKNQCS